MQEILDERRSDEGPIASHLAQCGVCRALFASLRGADAAVRAVVTAPVDEPRAERAARAALAGLGVAPHRRPAARPLLGLAAVASAVVLFAGGAWFGRCAWPREVVVVRTELQPQVVERVVERIVPAEAPPPRTIVRERVVVRTVRVPVAATPEAVVRSDPRAPVLAEGAPAALAIPPIEAPVFTHTLMPAPLAAPRDQAPPETGDEPGPHSSGLPKPIAVAVAPSPGGAR